MTIVLLSGGSGKRLWPLSSESRAKQFLKVLKTPDGKVESMLQRVYRQIQETGITSPVVIAAGGNQRALIQEQLGDGVDLVLEPERRDTFPAIALACGYLALEKGYDRDETIVVIPVDPFVELGYFRTLLRIDDVVKTGCADLVLMGITPDGPSEKYGYIVPECKDLGEVKRVARFTEKPTIEYAKNLLREGAFWNGGVFGFKLGFLMDVIHSYTAPTSFEEMVDSYSKLKKTSFDYEVVEQAESVMMVPYNGMWKDLGTWDALVEHLEDSILGNAIVQENKENVHIINELNIPIVLLGIENIVVAASNDGILVSKMDECDNLKPYVDRICEDKNDSDLTFDKLSEKADATTSDATREMNYHSI